MPCAFSLAYASVSLVDTEIATDLIQGGLLQEQFPMNLFSGARKQSTDLRVNVSCCVLNVSVIASCLPFKQIF